MVIGDDINISVIKKRHMIIWIKQFDIKQLN